MTYFIIPRRNRYGRTRSEQESNLRKDGFAAMSDENLDRLKYLERKEGIKDGFVSQVEVQNLTK